MAVATEQKSNHFVADYERLEQTRAGQSWFEPVRKAAIAHFSDQGFPTTRDEEWRFTNVSEIARTTFRLAGPPASPVSLDALRPYLFAEPAHTRLVFVNGLFDAKLSDFGGLPEQVTLAPLAGLMEAEADTLRPHLARYAAFESNPFTALNTAFFQDGAFIHVPRGLVLETPIHLVHYMTGGSEPSVAHPRVLIVAEEASQVTVIETYAGGEGGRHFTNAVTEIVAAEGAVVDHYKLQREADEGFHVATLRSHQGRSATVISHNITLGGGLTRNDVHSILDGEGGELDLNGLYLGRGRQHIDNHLRVEHAQPHCDSREYYKGILEDESHAVFTGRIVVHKDAQKTDAKQTNMNLLLSADAQIDTKPQLEIYADDVKCTHGATIGQIEETELFYLRSRGIPERDAKALLIYAFASESISRIKVAPLRDALESQLFSGAAESRLLREEAET